VSNKTKKLIMTAAIILFIAVAIKINLSGIKSGPLSHVFVFTYNYLQQQKKLLSNNQVNLQNVLREEVDFKNSLEINKLDKKTLETQIKKMEPINNQLNDFIKHDQAFLHIPSLIIQLETKAILSNIDINIRFSDLTGEGVTDAAATPVPIVPPVPNPTPVPVTDTVPTPVPTPVPTVEVKPVLPPITNPDSIFEYKTVNISIKGQYQAILSYMKEIENTKFVTVDYLSFKRSGYILEGNFDIKIFIKKSPVVEKVNG
jgi:hypothetical protein